MRSPCVRCGNALLTEQGRMLVSVNFTPDELAELAVQTTNVAVSERLCCAIGLLDPKLEVETRRVAGEIRHPTGSTSDGS